MKSLQPMRLLLTHNCLFWFDFEESFCNLFITDITNIVNNQFSKCTFHSLNKAYHSLPQALITHITSIIFYRFRYGNSFDNYLANHGRLLKMKRTLRCIFKELTLVSQQKLVAKNAQIIVISFYLNIVLLCVKIASVQRAFEFSVTIACFELS